MRVSREGMWEKIIRWQTMVNQERILRLSYKKQCGSAWLVHNAENEEILVWRNVRENTVGAKAPRDFKKSYIHFYLQRLFWPTVREISGSRVALSSLIFMHASRLSCTYCETHMLLDAHTMRLTYCETRILWDAHTMRRPSTELERPAIIGVKVLSSATGNSPSNSQAAWTGYRTWHRTRNQHCIIPHIPVLNKPGTYGRNHYRLALPPTTVPYQPLWRET